MKPYVLQYSEFVDTFLNTAPPGSTYSTEAIEPTDDEVMFGTTVNTFTLEPVDDDSICADSRQTSGVLGGDSARMCVSSSPFSAT